MDGNRERVGGWKKKGGCCSEKVGISSLSKKWVIQNSGSRACKTALVNSLLRRAGKQTLFREFIWLGDCVRNIKLE